MFYVGLQNSRRAFYWAEIHNDIKRDIGELTMNHWIGYIKDDRYYQIIKNITNLKECNYDKCRKKNVKLRKCKQCVSVYYCTCCREHRKYDWNANHKRECKVLTSRDYSLTLHTDFLKRFA